MLSQKPLLHIVMDEELIERIDDFRFENRFTSRAAAVKWLLEWALEQAPKPEAADRRRSTETHPDR